MNKFVDQAPIKVKSGHGGAGCTSFRREKYVPLGGPDGGDGGRGGDVYFEADNSIRTLSEVRRKKKFAAKNGAPGMGRNKSGEKGASLSLKLPVGTLVRESEGGPIIIDLEETGKRFLAAKGGKGGLGNQNFATATNQAPRYSQPGLPGEEREYFLELKLIADVGLVGLPNAGKSTLLKALTRARPKIANYPFTTLSPNLGVANQGELNQFVIADIPGIIEGASEGRGLGIDFLKHIERTRVLVLVIDFASDDPSASEALLLNELSEFSPALAKKPLIRVANKIDLPDAREKLADYPDYLPLSAVTHQGTKALLNRLSETLSRMD